MLPSDGVLKFCAGVAVGTAATVAALCLHESSRCRTQRLAERQLQVALGKELDVRDDNVGQDTDRKDDAYDEQIYQEQLVRNFQFFGESQKEIMRASVVVLGCGGVGSHCAIALARSGVGTIRLVDFDRVTISSLNRHGCATMHDVGRTKVECIKEYIKAFNQHVVVDAREALFEAECPEAVLDGKIDFVVDCIDHLPAKAGLIQWCKANGVPVISSCGAGAKADPTRIHITDIQHSKEDRLAKRLRDRLKQLGISEGVSVCYSSERTERTLLPLKAHQSPDTARQYSPFPEFRVRTVPVIAPLPAIMGNACASFVLCALADQPFQASEREALKKKTYRRFFDTLRKLDDRSLLPLPTTDVLYTTVYHAHSCVSMVQTGLQFLPWIFNSYEDSNWVPFSSKEALTHVQEGGTREKNLALYGAKMVATVETLIEDAKTKLGKDAENEKKALRAHEY